MVKHRVSSEVINIGEATPSLSQVDCWLVIASRWTLNIVT
jgi:hypothetical protein